MIATVTPNPSVDRTLDVALLRPGQLHRAGRVHVHPGGKGVNVARVLAARGERVRAIVPHGGAEGEQLLALLAERDIEVRAVPAGTAVRVNVAVVEPDGRTTKINEPGPRLEEPDAEAILAAVAQSAADAAWIVTCGSLPPGIGVDFHARVVRCARAAGARVAVDASGPPLLAALPDSPDLVKPNRRELEEAVGQPLRTLGDAAAAAAELRGLGAREVLASLGPAGALLAGDGGVLHAEAAIAVVRSTVGAGDTLLAGYLAAGGGWEGLRTGVAWATEAIGQPGTSLLATAGTAAPIVVVREDLDESRSLDAPIGDAAGLAVGRITDNGHRVREGGRG
jgi:1-phosphofructokinase